MAAPEAELVLKWEREQARLRQNVKEEDTEDWQRNADFSGLERVGGVDLSFIKGDDINACAHLVVLAYPHMKVLYEDCKMVTLNAPYVAGFLGFREAPPLLQALEKLKNVQPNLMPQVLFVDGNGLFHYREFGLACHLGVLSDLPCVGVAKNLLHVEGVVRSEEHQSQYATKERGFFEEELPPKQRTWRHGPRERSETKCVTVSLDRRAKKEANKILNTSTECSTSDTDVDSLTFSSSSESPDSDIPQTRRRGQTKKASRSKSTKRTTPDDVLKRYNKVIHAFKKEGSISNACTKVGVDRNTLALMAVVAEIQLVDPEFYRSIPKFRSKEEKLFDFSKRCLQLLTADARSAIEKAKKRA
ncbi:hypothetical protein QQF64_028863 [Cirrhinus molitorella]|uniref:Endonuclease V n=1 Tax=Cirrhinus molitorella TaxID=172907 RepID=A0ABR3N856_9TELE